jgi:hypothetical protein
VLAGSTRGKAALPIILAQDATPEERTAARELARYLSSVSGARFRIESAETLHAGAPAILVGGAVALEQGATALTDLGPEEWVMRCADERLLLYGGRPRGTLYAVYRFLEERIGVRWWTPYAESVPSRRRLSVPEFDARGKPTFEYRDLWGLDGPFVFGARHGLNGHHTRLTPQYGGSRRFGEPKHVHNFYRYVPPEKFFETRPDLFSEKNGERFVKRGQLCLTHPELLELVRERLAAYIERSRVRALRRGESPPEFFSFSPNDWGGMCRCENCAAVEQSTGSAAGALVRFVNRLGDAIRDDYPRVRLTTLAYLQTLPAPRDLSTDDNVVIRLAALHARDFSRPLDDPTQRELRQTHESWARLAPQLWIWDYAVAYRNYGDLPRPTLRVLASDLRYYRDLGVEGIFYQLDDPLGADMRALKQWVLLKLIDDPGRNVQDLVNEFTEGYFTQAAPAIRRYLTLLEAQVAANPAPLRFKPGQDDYRWLDAPFLFAAHTLFDKAEKRVAGDPIVLRRVRWARLSLDRATLWRWKLLFGRTDEARGTSDKQILHWQAVTRRYRETWYTQIGLKLPADERAGSRAEVDREIALLTRGLRR